MVRVVPELRRHVRFSQVNLVAETLPVDRDVDVIFLRNVLIYFAPATQKAVVRHLADHLRPSGYLILGHTEAAIGTGMGFEQIGTGVFRVT
jgi:chemotaxis protein methyltransferase CheR